MSYNQKEYSGVEIVELLLKPDCDYWIKPCSASRCVDGRSDPSNKNPGVQMLGGSLQPVVMVAILGDQVLNVKYLQDQLQKLQRLNYQIGVHYGSHRSDEEGRTDCGFADNLPVILQKVIDQSDEIKRRLRTVLTSDNFQSDDFEKNFDQVVDKLKYWLVDKLQIKGKEMIESACVVGGSCEHLQGEHGEIAAVVNLVSGTTFNTSRFVAGGHQVFNLDLWAAIEQSKALGASEDLAQVFSLILYVATEMVLIEDKGKKALPVVVRRVQA